MLSAIAVAGGLRPHDRRSRRPRWRRSKDKRAAGATPAWNKGILPISPESYYNAIECGKQGGADPPCVFWDTGLCKNDDFVLAMYTPYKQVAYEVWVAVSKKQPAPQPNYPAAQRTRITIGVTPGDGLEECAHRSGREARRPVARRGRSIAQRWRRPVHVRLSGVRRRRGEAERHDGRSGGQGEDRLLHDRRGGAAAVPVDGSGAAVGLSSAAAGSDHRRGLTPMSRLGFAGPAR